MMKKKRLPHILAAVALALFIGLGLASDGTTPAPRPAGGGSSTGCPRMHGCWAFGNLDGTMSLDDCGRPGSVCYPGGFTVPDPGVRRLVCQCS